MPERFRILRRRIKAGHLITYFQDRLTGNVFTTSKEIR